MALFNVCAADPGLINVFGTMQMGGGSFQWLKNTVCAIERQMASLTGDSPYELMTRQAAASPPGARNLLFLPYLRGERSPRWNPSARGAFVGLTAGHGRGDLIRAVMEGVTFNLKIIREALKGQDASIREMRAVGGGAESPLWRQILADVFGEPIHVPTLLEGANPLGAALIAGVGVGLFQDFSVVDRLNPIVSVQEPSGDPAVGETYARLFAAFEQAYRALRAGLRRAGLSPTSAWRSAAGSGRGRERAASPAASSRATSSAPSFQPVAPRLSLSCSRVRAPRIGTMPSHFRSSQFKAACAGLFPVCRATCRSASTTFQVVSLSRCSG